MAGIRDWAKAKSGGGAAEPEKKDAKRTYTTRERSRGNSQVGPVDLVRTETIHADGRVDVLVKGISDGDPVNQKATRTIPTPVDWDRIERSRLSSGWHRSG